MNWNNKIVKRRFLARLIMRAPLAAAFMAATAALATTATAFAATKDSAGRHSAESFRFQIAGFSLSGENPLGERRTDALLAQFLEKEVSVADLRNAAEMLEEALAQAGYNFHRVTLPPQKLRDGDTIRFEIDALALGAVEAVGNNWFSDRNVIASMPVLKAGSTPNSRQVSNALTLAKENPAKDVHVVFVRGEFPGTVDARLTVTDQDPHDLLLWANNSGSDLSSRSRAGVQYSHRNVWGRDHNLSLSYSFSPEDTSELNQYGVNYLVPLYGLRSKFNAFYSNSEADTGRVADVFDVSGSGETAGFSITRLLARYGDYQHQFGFSVTDKLFDSDVDFDGVNLGTDVRSRPAGIFYDWNYRLKQATLVGNISWFTNLSGGSLNDQASYTAAKLGASRNWQRVNAALDINFAISQQWSALARLRAQTSDDRLISGEQFGLGGVLGNAGPRGFLERETATDTGAAGALEVWRRFQPQRLSLGVFYDFARGSNNDVLSTEQKRQSLASTGVSMRWDLLRNLRVDVDFGYVLNGVDGTQGTGSLDDDSRWHISLRYFPQIGGKQ